MNNKIVTVDGIKITKNPLTGTWFIFARESQSGKDCTISGTLAEMKKCAKSAAKKNSIIQD